MRAELQSEADDFVGKPIHAEELLARVRAGLRTAKLKEELARKALGSQTVSAQLATMKRRESLGVVDHG